MADEENPFDFGIDPDREELTNDGPPIDPKERVAIIRTSDRSGFRRCRRRWGWQSHLRGNLTSIENASPLWFGSGFHYALEDFHGLRKHSSAKEAFKAYARATHRMSKATNQPFLLPFDFLELVQLGYGMLDYYTDHWLVARDPLKTFVWRGKPQVEVHALIEVPFKSPHYDRVLYAVTIDRVVEDEMGGLWLVDYKTAKRIQTLFYQTDPQISAYCWIARQLYGRPITGFIYQQHRKDVPDDPRILSTGKVSTAPSLKTSHRHYRRTLINLYGDVLRAPKENVDYLNYLNEQEDDMKDRFIRRDKVYRNEHQAEAEGTKLLLELEEMLNPDLPLYPNPTRDCGPGMCSFHAACVSMDDGDDWEYELEVGFRQKDAVFDGWRNYLPQEFQ